MNLKYAISAFFTVTVVTLGLGACSELPPDADIDSANRVGRAEQFMRAANAARQGGNFAPALALYRRAHAADPEIAEPLIAFGDTAMAIGSFSEAAEAYRKALALAPGNGAARRGYGKTLIALEQPALALEQFRAALVLNNKDVEAYNGIGVAHDLLGEHKTAQDYYLDGIERAPDNLPIRNSYGLSLALAGHYQEAIRVLTEIVDAPAATPRNRLNLALVHGLAGHADMAAEIQRGDLSDAEIRRNIEYYEWLRNLSSDERRAAILGYSGRRRP
jgi:Flp pilus assembly protein TadD